MATSTITVSTFAKQGTTAVNSGNVMTCWREGNSGASSTCDLGSSSSSYNNMIAVRFNSIGVTRVKNAKVTLTFGSYDYKAAMTFYCKACANITSSHNGTNMPTTYGSAVTCSISASSLTSTTTDITSAINSALANGSKCVYFYTTSSTANNRKTKCSSIVLTYEPATYSITFYRNQTTSDTTKLTKTYTVGETNTFPYTEAGWTYTGHTFAGWNMARDGSGTGWTSQNTSITDTFLINNAGSSIYMQWSTNKANLIYYSNGGTVLSDDYYTSSSTSYIQKTSSNSPTFHSLEYNTSTKLYNADTFGLTRSGYTFGGWYRYGDSSTIYNCNTSIGSTQFYQYNDTSKTTANTSIVECWLYAYWIPNTFTVIYDLDGGFCGGNELYSDGYNISYSNTYTTLPILTYKNFDPVKFNHLITGWCYKDDDGNSYSLNEDNTLASIKENCGIDLTQPGSEITVYPIWQPCAFLYYDLSYNGGSHNIIQQFVPVQDDYRLYLTQDDTMSFYHDKNRITLNGTLTNSTTSVVYKGINFYSKTISYLSSTTTLYVRLVKQAGSFSSTTYNPVYARVAVIDPTTCEELAYTLISIRTLSSFGSTAQEINCSSLTSSKQYGIKVSWYVEASASATFEDFEFDLAIFVKNDSADYSFTGANYETYSNPGEDIFTPAEDIMEMAPDGYTFGSWKTAYFTLNEGDIIPSWIYTGNGVYSIMPTLIEVVNNILYIYNGEGFIETTPYVYIDGSWREATAYVYDGSKWAQSIK